MDSSAPPPSSPPRYLHLEWARDALYTQNVERFKTCMDRHFKATGMDLVTSVWALKALCTEPVPEAMRSIFTTFKLTPPEIPHD